MVSGLDHRAAALIVVLTNAIHLSFVRKKICTIADIEKFGKSLVRSLNFVYFIFGFIFFSQFGQVVF